MEGRLTRASGEKSARREKFIFLFLFCCSLLWAFFFFFNSGNAERLMEKKSLLALGEVGVLSLYIFAVLFFRKRIFTSKKNYLLCLSFPLLLSAYLHRFLLPLGISLLYFSLLASGFGFLLSGKLSYFPKKMKELLASLPYKIEAFLILPFLFIQMNRSNIALDYDSLRYGLRGEYTLFSFPDAVFTGGQSLSEGILSFLKGFFSSHGLLNAVYSYPKGLELLTAPLTVLPGYGFLLAFQIWTYLAIALVLFLLSRRIHLKSGMPILLLFFFFSSIGNMSITAKTDNITLLLQVLSLYFYAKRERKNSVSMLILSYSFKPTAVVFSTLILVGLFLDSLLKGTIREFFFKEMTSEGERTEEVRVKEVRVKEVSDKEVRHPKKEKRIRQFCILGTRQEGSTVLLLVSLFFTSLVTLRTFLITGLPFSTTFTGIFKAMGFSVKWPFNLDAHVDYSGEKPAFEVVLSVVKRVFFFLFYPVGEDMKHVSIAWSGVVFPAVLFLAFKNAVCVVFPKGKKYAMKGIEGLEDEGGNYSYLRIVFLLISFFSLLSFSMLWQIDGNYYILWECLALLLAASSLLWSEKQGFLRTNKWIKGLFPLTYLASILITLVTSWAGAVGFTPIDFVNKGYYDHFAVEKDKQAKRGSLPLFLKMAENPNNHVLAVAETPECYQIPCIVESITDVEGSGGNPGLHNDPLYFAWFLKWAKTDYIYIEKPFLEEEREKRTKKMLGQMAELGILIEPEFSTEPSAIMSVDDFDLAWLLGRQEGGEKDFKNLTKTQDSFPKYLLVKVNQSRLEYAWREEPYPTLTKDEEENAKRVWTWIERELDTK